MGENNSDAEKYKKLLSEEKLTEREKEEVINNLRELAQLAFEVFWHRKQSSKNPVGLFTDKQ